MQTFVQAGSEKFRKKLALHGTFPAAKRDAAVRVAVERGISSDDLHDFLNFVFAPRHAGRCGGAFCGTGTAANAAREIAWETVLSFQDSAVGTYCGAMTTSGAQIRKVHELGDR